MDALAASASTTAAGTPMKDQVGRWENIPAVVYPRGMSDKLCHRYELVENLRRAELTREERKRLETEYGKMLVTDTNSVAQPVASREWNEFKTACGIANGSDKCTIGEFEQFLEWRVQKGEAQAKVGGRDQRVLLSRGGGSMLGGSHLNRL
jgi:hypothetical protein